MEISKGKHYANSVIDKLKKIYDFENDVNLAEKLGISKGVLSNWRKRGSLDLRLIIEKCSDLDLNWLLQDSQQNVSSMVVNEPHLTYEMQNKPKHESYPLIPLSAFAGISTNNDYSIQTSMIEESYVVPLFKGKGVDFLIPVRGSSMYPSFTSGDVVACMFVKDRLFIQWNKVYVLDTKSQGIIIKRLRKSPNQDTVTCRSDNAEYEDFEVPLSDVRTIALVLGIIRLE